MGGGDGGGGGGGEGGGGAVISVKTDLVSVVQKLVDGSVMSNAVPVVAMVFFAVVVKAPGLGGSKDK